MRSILGMIRRRVPDNFRNFGGAPQDPAPLTALDAGAVGAKL
jgi:hypothetical protein